jgi:hypothetical protein
MPALQNRVFDAKRGDAAPSGSLQLEDFVLYAKFLALQIMDRLLIGEGAAILLLDGAVDRGVLFLQNLEAILQ